MPRKRVTNQPTKPFVVYVTFPSSSKEYAYWCDIPGVRQGSYFSINGGHAIVRRTAEYDESATKWVPGSSGVVKYARREAIAKRLHEIEREETLLTRWAALRSPEAKRLVRELKELTK